MRVLGEFTTSVKKALSEIDPNWEKLPGLVVAGSHDPKEFDPENLIGEIRVARERGEPFLGICYGHQLAAIEYARNVLGRTMATSAEFVSSNNPNSEIIVKRLPKLEVGYIDGETYWHNYEVDPRFLTIWKKPPHFLTCQYHPEYQSSKDKPHPLLVQFLDLCRGNAG